MFDTHAHLNFHRFAKNLEEVIGASKKAGVHSIVVPGTDVVSSQKAVEIAEAHDGIYAAVGIHPHHVYEMKNEDSSVVLKSIEGLLQNDTERKIVAIGEIGLDRHIYENTKYVNYHVDDSFITLQKELVISQLDLAKKYERSVIIHNREAKQDILPLLQEHWDSHFEGRIVFHCCEPDEELLQFARNHSIFIGIDGDVTYREDKQAFIKKVPLEMLVLETDSPFLLPEPLRSEKKFPNTSANLPLIASFIADLRGESVEELSRQTTENAHKLFSVSL